MHHASCNFTDTITSYDFTYLNKENVELLARVGWADFVWMHHAPCDFSDTISSLPHPAASYLMSFKQDDMPV
jgi:hypothetical protein